jgi:BirA family transcriptional regulator, biotin operon repressor / biotin---[acetyl-CoA-carboxylase] ligase
VAQLHSKAWAAVFYFIKVSKRALFFVSSGITTATHTAALFDISTFYRLLQTGWLGRRFWYFRKLESTNRHLHDMPDERLTHGLVCLADSQVRGKGQFGRSWYSSPGDNLTFTVALKPRTNSKLQLISLAAILAIRETVQATASCECEIKWPNDLLISGEKAAGILTECRYNGHSLDRMLLGIGINVNQQTFPPELEGKATSVRSHTGGQPLERSLFLAVLLNRLEPLLVAAENGDIELIRNINRSIQGYGKWVSLLVDGKREETPVKILGINESGYLMVLTANDDVKTFTHEQVRIEIRPD